MKFFAFCIKLIIFSSIYISLSASIVFSQVYLHWTQLPNYILHPNVSPYFVNKDVGFLFSLLSPVLYRTTDGGNSWIFIDTFSPDVYIQQLYFVSIAHGYLASLAGIYETTDTGSTWRQIYHSDECYSVYSYGNKVYTFTGGTGGAVYVYGALLSTTDDGAHWKTEIPAPSGLRARGSEMPPYIFGNRDSLVFAETFDVNGNKYLYHTTNNGNDWASNIIDSVANPTKTLGSFCFPHCSDILRTYTANNFGDVSSISRSTDFGKTWTDVFPHREIGGWIEGTNCAVYVSKADEGGKNGLYRSTDRGQNWEYVPGPDIDEIDDGDFPNLSVVGGGAVVLVGDVHINIWESVDGGDGLLSESALASHIDISHDLSNGKKDTLSLSQCDTGSVRLFYQNISCNYAGLKQVAVEGLDSSEYTTLLKHHAYCDGIPDTLLINIHPSIVGVRNVVIKTHFEDDEFYTIDTGFSFTLETPASSEHTANIFVKSKNIIGQAGDSLEIPIFINSILSNLKTDASTIEITYSLNTELLTPLDFIPIKGITADSIRMTKGTVTVTLHFDSSFTFSGETQLGILRCMPYLIDTLETDIALSGMVHSSGCLSILTDSNSIRFSLNGCGSKTLSDFLRGKIPELLIHPNPAENSIAIESSVTGDANIEIFDELGRVVSNSQSFVFATEKKALMDVSMLAAGTYYLRINFGRMIISKSLVISR
jgi:photosystem II stability/assembly factor-like uncharacterized protein